MVSGEMPAKIIIFTLYVMCLFPLAILRFSLYLWFLAVWLNLPTYSFLGICPTCGSLKFKDLWDVAFNQIFQ